MTYVSDDWQEGVGGNGAVYEFDQHTTLLGPQPTPVQCCPSCRIVAQAVTRLAYHLGYDETGDELTELLAEMGDDR